MAPSKSLKTYSRGGNSSISCVDAVNILFAKNLAARKLNGRVVKKKNKNKIQLKELPKQIKTVLSDESSLHVNFNDTFDKLLKGSNNYNNNRRKPRDISVKIYTNNLSKSVIHHRSVDNSSMLSKLRSYSSKSKTEISQQTLSWFKQPSLSRERITNELEIEVVGKDGQLVRKKSTNDSSRSPIMLRSRSRIPEIVVTGEKTVNNSSSLGGNNNGKVVMQPNETSILNSSLSFNPLFTNSVREQILVHCSTPLVSKKTKSLVKQPLSPIKGINEEIKDSIIESLEEIKSWDTSLNVKSDDLDTSLSKQEPFKGFDKRNSFITVRGKFSERNSNNRRKVQTNTTASNRYFSLEDFELFYSKVSHETEVNNFASFSLKDFEEFHAKHMSKFSNGETKNNKSTSINFVTSRRQKIAVQTGSNSVSTNNKLDLKSLVVLLDKVLVNNVSSDLTKRKSHSLDNYNSSRRMTRLSLRSQNNSTNGFKACRKFSRNSTPNYFRNSEEKSLAKPDFFSLKELFCELTRLPLQSNNSLCTITEVNDSSDKKKGKTSLINDKEKSVCKYESKKSPKRPQDSIEKSTRVLRSSDYNKIEETSYSKIEKTSLEIRFSPDKSERKSQKNSSIRIEQNEELKLEIQSRFSKIFADHNDLYSVQDLSNSIVEKTPKKDSPIIIKDIVIDLTLDDLDLLSRRTSNRQSQRCSGRLARASNNIDTPEVDVVDSSLTTPQRDNFLMPVANSKWKNKILKLKAGKSWRRSLLAQKKDGFVDLTESYVGDNDTFSTPVLSSKPANPRQSIKIVPVSNESVCSRRKTNLQNYARTNLSLVLDESLEEIIGIVSPVKTKVSLPKEKPLVTAKEIVLQYCKQSDIVPFEKAYPNSVLKNCTKIGEGVYGEVFLYTKWNKSSVMKIIPIEGDKIINGEKQKKYHEIISEVVIASQLSDLRKNSYNGSAGFCEVQSICCVRGKYPKILQDRWHEFDNMKGSENDPPEVFTQEQLYIILSLAHAGQDLESFVFNNSVCAVSMFKQVAYSLAIAEQQLKFEHRDLHWGNVLLKPAEKNKKILCKHKGEEISIPAQGVEATVIDFTLSRIEHDGVVIFNDLGLDPDLFVAEGDYQFEIYRLMRNKNNNDWERFEPYTNVLWLHYIVKKAIKELRYKNTKTKVHAKGLEDLQSIEEEILSYKSASEFVESYY
ncbi:uncharacterized protein LOC115891840 [Sitophilus oryzae]|uniref:non-specific serine/threonine protein kinase n=1 Tax=Sitophilus oryzae TaxID=7048 RepID=A0A6J2YYM7_SITOR|nr:uncharacterized protein LOC115891840 [Sitophilus oryzae]